MQFEGFNRWLRVIHLRGTTPDARDARAGTSSSAGGRAIARQHFTVRKADASELEAATRQRGESERSRRIAARDDQLRRALNEAATRAPSEAMVIEPTDGEKIGTIRAALVRLLESEPRNLNWGIRDGRIIITRGELPTAARGRRKGR